MRTTPSTSTTTIWGTGTVSIMRKFSTPTPNTFTFNSWDSDFNKTANNMMTAITLSMVTGGLVLLCAIVAVVMWIMRRRRFDQPLSQPVETAIQAPAPTATVERDTAAGNGARPTQQPARSDQARFVDDPDPVYLPPAPVDQEPLYLPPRAQPLTAVNRASLHRSSSI
ncbi:hypothetical protein GGF32_008510 [Allomyces javanicus]|nr:hypothetical protein GGF32_008510 [Allomyces javanicus]